ncbi:uncharacterized protein TNCV_2948921 [Trichonephila clavipes]|nr:uncharacterized protein TNCV_2948921 [Trichonephila clavipes]
MGILGREREKAAFIQSKEEEKIRGYQLRSPPRHWTVAQKHGIYLLQPLLSESFIKGSKTSGNGCSRQYFFELDLTPLSGDGKEQKQTLILHPARPTACLNRIEHSSPVPSMHPHFDFIDTTSNGRSTTRGLLATDHVILNHGQVTWTTPELAPPLLTPTPPEDVSALDRFNVHRCPTWRVFSGTGLELVTRQATIRYLYHSATAATQTKSERKTNE